ncbi:MAG: aminotransferase class V-fold PLP-dependent enzyme [Planctomycetales bacterium]|nr:aminotransferase class V-fold PLP-dependent enzyme [Planctomycetales bacterium]NIM07885.1 aminotransferase class V-fold PLP-dependent enzyme [Planctomycetales bacterium]NIN09025.1 aminotransferase class V-fold PLP-dependent enzyme [Planctomycetales bacterium]NIN78138.1 aminotransferase class V-fold PLP-dependent enzyme [Planctomycetales bacterium]NIO33666.1 aminotransferase class V-fold PLP-dependent enzyme [Planctomycetales bacterium]
MISKQAIYLDHNATTPLDPRVADAMRQAAAESFANPASQHGPGRQARRTVERARQQIGQLLGADMGGGGADRLIFTSGATEANNLALRGLAGQPPGRLIISAIEHPSVVGTAENLHSLGFEISLLPVDGDGIVQVDALPARLTPDTRLVSVMLGNNETGALQPIERLAAHCAAAGVPLHTDAAQVAGKLPIDFRNLGATALTFTAHKFHGPRGVGGLLIRDGTTLAPILFGGFQQGGLRPGSEPVELVVGMCEGLKLWDEQSAERRWRIADLRDRFERQLRAAWPAAVVHAARALRLPHTSCISFPGLDRQALLMALDQAGVACSTGSACASGSSEPSRVLLAMGCERSIVDSALRFSLGVTTTAEEVDEAVRRILRVLNRLGDRGQPPNRSELPPLERSQTV